MENYIKDFLDVIRYCSFDNTYKMSWGKSIVECCVESPNSKTISFERISRKVFKYYWNQTIFFNLQQSPNPHNPPTLITYVNEEIKNYQFKHGNKPQKFERIEEKINLDSKRLIKILKENVCWRFLNIGDKTYPLYELDLKSSSITLPYPELVNEYSDILFEMINYRWTQMLENFNSSPRISKKVKITDHGDIKRGDLNKFRKYLSIMGQNCFICSKLIENETPSIDHVVPWSYMYSDDIWNLVYTHQSCNSSKSNKLIDEQEISKLENRNKLLLDRLTENNIKDKHTEELSLSIEKNYVRKFWIGFKG